MKITLEQKELELAIREYMKHHFSSSTMTVEGVNIKSNPLSIYAEVIMEKPKNNTNGVLYRNDTGGAM